MGRDARAADVYVLSTNFRGQRCEYVRPGPSANSARGPHRTLSIQSVAHPYNHFVPFGGKRKAPGPSHRSLWAGATSTSVARALASARPSNSRSAWILGAVCVKLTTWAFDQLVIVAEGPSRLHEGGPIDPFAIQDRLCLRLPSQHPSRSTSASANQKFCVSFVPTLTPSDYRR